MTTMKTNPISGIWVHEDMLNPSHPLFVEHPKLPAIGIFDSNYYKQQQYSFKRCVFIYECYSACPITLYSGDTLQILLAIITQEGWQSLYTAPTLNPVYQNILTQLSQHIRICYVSEPEFAGGPKAQVGPRFMRYWWQVRKAVLRAPNQDGTDAS